MTDGNDIGGGGANIAPVESDVRARGGAFQGLLVALAALVIAAIAIVASDPAQKH
jgi:hypothetical protein